MSIPLLYLTGFGAFPGVERNPSGELARSLAADPPAGLEVAGVVLPVSFLEVPAAFDGHLEELGRRPDLLLATGVHRGPSFRLERRARPELRPGRPDAAGECADGLVLAGGELATDLPLERLGEALGESGAGEVELSEDAGRYVCERTYHHVLTRAAGVGVPGLFLHVPPLELVPLEHQRAVLTAWLPRLAEIALGARG